MASVHFQQDREMVDKMRLTTRLKSRGGFFRSLKEYGVLGFVDRGLRLVWTQLGIRLLAAIRPPYESNYGWLEALLLPSQDFWVRYATVCRELVRLFPEGNMEILEVGSGPIGLDSFLTRESRRIWMIDRSYANVSGPQSNRVVRICCDACQMPFSDGAFQVVVSLDTLEHIPRDLRPAFLNELKRVASRAVVLSCPVDSSSKEFQARSCDAELVEGLMRRGTPSARWPEEHLSLGHPTIEELRDNFAGASIEGRQNARAWKRLQLFNNRRLAWLFGGPYYLLALARHDSGAPYYRALIVWEKQKAPECQPLPAGAMG